MLSEDELETEVELLKEKPTKTFKLPKTIYEKEESLFGAETKKIDSTDYSKPPE
jgi:hypothetical protein